MKIKLGSNHINTKDIVPFLLGFFVCQNIIYVFRVNNTYINICQFIGPVIVACELLKRKNKLRYAIKGVDHGIMCFFFIGFFSVVCSIITVIRYPSMTLSTYFVGIIGYLLYFLYYISLLIYRANVKAIIKGLVVGVYINIFISLLQYVFFVAGRYFSLYKVFPQTAFFISIPWESRGLVANFTDASLVYFYRANGLFLEVGHLLGFLSVVLPFFLLFAKKGPLKQIALFLMFFLSLISKSGAFVALLLSLILYILLGRLKEGKISLRRIGVFFLVIFFVFVVLITTPIGNKIQSMWGALQNSIATASITNADNATRYSYMVNSFEAFINNIWGIGWNMSSSYLRLKYGVVTTFNYYLEILLELGVIGLIVYLGTLFVNLKRTFVRKEKLCLALSVSLMEIIVIQCFLGTGLAPYIYLVLTLCCCRKDGIGETL